MKSKSAHPPKVEVRNLQRKVRVSVVTLRKFAAKAVARCLQLSAKKRTDLESLREISVLIVSDRRMAALHRRFMNEPGTTDVITFQHGEIFISADTARRNARRFGDEISRELRLYVVHGFLHLHGFDDRDEPGTQKMRAMEREILRNCSRRGV
jgi:probable rRNA maturation factor